MLDKLEKLEKEYLELQQKLANPEVIANQNEYKIETKIFKDCEHRIPTDGASAGLKFLKKNLY